MANVMDQNIISLGINKNIVLLKGEGKRRNNGFGSASAVFL